MEPSIIYATRGQYKVAVFLPHQTVQYKAMRLEALEREPGMFGNSRDVEAAFTAEQWQQRVVNPLGASFGLYDGEELIGITGITGVGQKEGEVYMTQSYIREAYRGKKLSRLLYEARFSWARAHNIKRLLIGHKRSNHISKAANQHYGFTYTHSEPRSWPDGSEEDMVCYELRLMDNSDVVTK